MQIYSFANVVALINGRELTGWDEGDDAIQVKRSADSATHKMGAGGEMCVSLGTDKSGEFTFKLMSTSPSNAYLNELMNRQEGGAATFVPVGVLMQDTFRQDRASGSTGYLKKPADIVRGAKTGTQEWTIVVENLDMIFGATNGALPA